MICTPSGFVWLSLSSSFALAIHASPEGLASSYSLLTSTSLPFPTSTLSSSDSQSLIGSQWSLSKGRIQDQGEDLTFVTDPFPSGTSTSPVLQVAYPAGSFSHNTGGAQFENLWNTSDGSNFQSMVLSYDIAFDKDFDWVKGGKLPGLRGGSNITGCSGGDEPTGLDCFSTRLMWRPDGAGEVYAYIPTSDAFCQDEEIICNSDFGVSISRGSFSIISGVWNRITLLVQLNNPVSNANGNLQLYFNDLQVISKQNIQFRKGSTVDVNGLYFSTFFGGSDDTWATPNTTHTYYRNIQLWAGADPSNITVTTNSAVKAAKRVHYRAILRYIFIITLGLLLL
ncbi:hypothetical protein D9757_000593 [Collybiopsis confluens]|uniref:Polysaccharide lyase 14 domain-containing protein n=1 Tax=Collybiopsis confluens TaxID=2823264 RepID=A0A8H5I1N0_9AGAR|nr:hypothetical protein D9757_000593 [Collybiopsis confluens]